MKESKQEWQSYLRDPDINRENRNNKSWKNRDM